MKKCLLILLALSLKTCYTAEAGQAPLTAKEMALLLKVSEQPSEEPTLSQLETKLQSILDMNWRKILTIIHPDINQNNQKLANAVFGKVNGTKNGVSAKDAINAWAKYIKTEGIGNVMVKLPDLDFFAANDEQMAFFNEKEVPWISEDDVEALKRIKAEREQQAQAAAAANQAHAAWLQQQAQAHATARAWLQQRGPWQQQAQPAAAAWQQQQQTQPAWQKEAEKSLGEEYLEKQILIKLKIKMKQVLTEGVFRELQKIYFNHPNINNRNTFHWCVKCHETLHGNKHATKNGCSSRTLITAPTISEFKEIQQTNGHTPCPHPECGYSYKKDSKFLCLMAEHIAIKHPDLQAAIEQIVKGKRPAAEDDDGEPEAKRRC